MKECSPEVIKHKKSGAEGLFVDSADRLFPSDISKALSTKLIGRQIYCFDYVSSTMDRAASLAQQNAPEGTVVVAESQLKGRGRRGRPWVSPKFRGLYFSVILRPRIPFSSAALLTLLAAVSICEALRNFCGCEAAIKWPNDILLEQKKVGGILTEIKAETGRISFIILGIGLNINAEPHSLVPGAVSLHEVAGKARKDSAGKYLDRGIVLCEVLRSLEENYLMFQKKGSGQILQAWRNYAVTLGQRVKVSSVKGHCEGEALDISPDGGLIVRTDTGLMEKIMAGDVVHCR
jgi:BirA family biotin operon repressor/biotin-[acetyl-CoA-carboxylase] ligase